MAAMRRAVGGRPRPFASAKPRMALLVASAKRATSPLSSSSLEGGGEGRVTTRKKEISPGAREGAGEARFAMGVGEGEGGWTTATGGASTAFMRDSTSL